MDIKYDDFINSKPAPEQNDFLIFNIMHKQVTIAKKVPCGELGKVASKMIHPGFCQGHHSVIVIELQKAGFTVTQEFNNNAYGQALLDYNIESELLLEKYRTVLAEKYKVPFDHPKEPRLWEICHLFVQQQGVVGRFYIANLESIYSYLSGLLDGVEDNGTTRLPIKEQKL